MEKTRPKVLLVDDNRMYAQRLSSRLDREFSVTYVREAGEANERAMTDSTFDAYVLDIVMPPPEGLEEETEDGFLAGVWLLSQLKKRVISRSIAVVVITNHTNFDRVRDLISGLEISPALVSVQDKKTTIKKLVEIVRTRIIAAQKLRSTKEVESVEQGNNSMPNQE